MAPKDILTKSFLEQEYIKNKKSINVIAKENNIKSENSVTQALIRHNLYREKLKNPGKILTKKFLIQNYITEYKSQKEITRMLNIQNKSTVRRYLEKYNIPIRKHTKSNTYIKAQKSRRKYEDISKSYWRSITKCAEVRNLEFNIDAEYCWQLFLKQNKKCALSGVEIKFNDVCNHKSDQTASLDRIDSTKGYTNDNIQWVHKTINYIKMDLPDDEFIDWCKKVAKNRDKT